MQCLHRIPDPSEREMFRGILLSTAQSIVTGTRCLTHNARAMGSLHRVLGDDSEDFLIFVLIDLETAHIPIGRLRELWHPEFLPIVDAEREGIERYYKEKAHKAATNLLTRFGQP